MVSGLAAISSSSWDESQLTYVSKRCRLVVCTEALKVKTHYILWRGWETVLVSDWMEPTSLPVCFMCPLLMLVCFHIRGLHMLKRNSRQNATEAFFVNVPVKPSYKSIITMKEAILRFTVFLCSGENHLQWECYRHFHDNIAIFRAEQATANMSFFSVTHKHKQCCQCWCSCVETLVMLPAKFHVVSRLLTVLKIENLMPS